MRNLKQKTSYAEFKEERKKKESNHSVEEGMKWKRRQVKTKRNIKSSIAPIPSGGKTSVRLF